ncbi:MAG: hypothetical protein Kow00109_09230 [Acidobacteriota bacterium]
MQISSGFRRRVWGGLAALLGTLLAGVAFLPAFPRFREVVESPQVPECYQPGDQIDAATVVYDEQLQPRRLLDILVEGPPVTVLVLFGGAALRTPPGEFRGPLWCQDSFDDLAVQRAVANSFRSDRVRFVGVAVPPVLGPEKYGFPGDLGIPGTLEQPAVREALRRFVERTNELRDTGLLPYAELFFDPELRLLRRSGVAPAWAARFKWAEDPRSYGVPTIWVLGRDGFVLAPPFWGNDYGSRPPEIHYGYADLVARIRQVLGEAAGPAEAAPAAPGS